MLKARWLYLGLLGLAVVQTIYFYPQLPDTVASHFNARGEANDWSSKQGLFAVYWGTLALMVAIFMGLPPLMAKLPNVLINLPNKQYWLAPERREQTLRRFGEQMHWFGSAVLLLLIIIFHMAFSASVPGSSDFPSLVAEVSMGLFLVFVVCWVVRMLRAYRLPRS